VYRPIVRQVGGLILSRTTFFTCVEKWRSCGVKKKVKQSRYTPWRRLGGRELLLIHDLGTRWGEWSPSRPGRALPPGKGPPVPIVQEAGWAPEPVWTQRLEKKSFTLAGDRTPIVRSSMWTGVVILIVASVHISQPNRTVMSRNGTFCWSRGAAMRQHCSVHSAH